MKVDNLIKYSISTGQYKDGKSVCLWRGNGIGLNKIARFQSDEAARMFAEDFNFPVSDDVKKRIYGDNEEHSCGGPLEACCIPGCAECGAGRLKESGRTENEVQEKTSSYRSVSDDTRTQEG